jgi:hypothetical protein
LPLFGGDLHAFEHPHPAPTWVLATLVTVGVLLVAQVEIRPLAASIIAAQLQKRNVNIQDIL